MDKIALEEHFSVPQFKEYSSSGDFISDKSISDDIVRRLADFDDLRLEAMDQAGLTKSILSHTAPGVEAARDRVKAAADARTINDYLARQIGRHPDRFGGFATLPTQSPKDAADEFERAIRQLGFHGALINGHTHGHYLDEDRYAVFWERVQEVGRPIYLHPTNAFQFPQNYQDHPELTGALWGWLPETATHVLRMVFSGLFDRYPGVQIILGHGGEALPYLLWRLDSRYKIESFGLGLKKLPSAYLRDNVSITTAGLFSTPPLRCALEEMGEDRVLFSIDYPYESSKEAGDWFDGVDLPDATLVKVATANARRLLHLDKSS